MGLQITKGYGAIKDGRYWVGIIKGGTRTTQRRTKPETAIADAKILFEKLKP